jgi:membrane protease YdiL (CAAX protease family)
MEISVVAQRESDRYLQVASRLHTISVLVVVGIWAFCGKGFADQMRVELNPPRVRLYAISILFEWLLLVFVLWGVRRRGAPLLAVLGESWHSVRQALRDIGIAVAFWIGSAILLVIFGSLLRVTPAGQDLRYLFPNRGVEITLWIALSITAGICEEAIFRGYLQRQFITFTKSVPTGILLAAAVFGAAHAYQGPRRAVLIGLYGVMFGVLAHLRRSVRPGMIAHAWQDSLAGVLASVLRRLKPA